MMSNLLYKYRDLNNYRFFIDIILKRRLYAAKFSDLNDPMEGQYFYNDGELNESVRNKILSNKNKLRVCSLSRRKDNELMWSHYAGGQRGVVIGVTIDSPKYDIRPVNYTGLSNVSSNIIHADSVKTILSHKLEVWEYEEEERVFIENEQYVDANVEQIIVGRSMSNQDFGFVRELIEKIDPNIQLIKANSYM